MPKCKCFHGIYLKFFHFILRWLRESYEKCSINSFFFLCMTSYFGTSAACRYKADFSISKMNFESLLHEIKDLQVHPNFYENPFILLLSQEGFISNAESLKGVQHVILLSQVLPPLSLSKTKLFSIHIK